MIYAVIENPVLHRVYRVQLVETRGRRITIENMTNYVAFGGIGAGPEDGRALRKVPEDLSQHQFAVPPYSVGFFFMPEWESSIYLFVSDIASVPAAPGVPPSLRVLVTIPARQQSIVMPIQSAQ